MRDADRSLQRGAEGQVQQSDQAEGLRRAMAARPAALARRVAAQGGAAAGPGPLPPDTALPAATVSPTHRP